MANTLVLLERITVGAAGATSVTFNNIPQTGYTDLKLVVSARNTDTGRTYGSIQINGNTSSIYSDLVIFGSGTTNTQQVHSSLTYVTTISASSSTDTASTFGSAEVYFPNYTSSNYKSFSIEGAQENNATAGYDTLGAGLAATSSPITSITVLALTGSFSWAQNSTFSLYGVSAVGTTPTKAPKALGGDIIETDGTYWYHAFLSSGTFTPATGLSCDILVVAGGGGAGNYGGGGAGGLQGFTAQALTANTGYTVTVGSGGSGSGTSGTNSQFGSLTASVGGGGAPGGGNAGLTGGSGGGGGYGAAGGSGTSGQGNAGGTGFAPSSGGGGGGAGAVGGNATATTGGVGGVGSSAYSSWGLATGTGENVSGTVYFAGGGGGRGASTNSNGGYGGYGSVGTSGNPAPSTGGGGNGLQTGVGASGVVIVRYLV